MKKPIVFVLSGLIIFTAQAPSARTGSDLPDRLAQHIAAFADSFDGATALATVAFLQNYWRSAGNSDYNYCADWIAAHLASAGYDSGGQPFSLRIDDVAIKDEMAWQPYSANLEIIAPIDTVLHSLDQAKMCLCINSSSTPAAGFVGDLVAIDLMTAIGKGSLRGMVAFTAKHPMAILHDAIEIGGAAGIISAQIPEYNRPESHQKSISMSAIPQYSDREVFGFKVSYGSKMLIDSLLAHGGVRLRAKVATAFLPKVVREITAEIIGTQQPNASIALIAHLDEPGANDNASGAATLLEIATALRTEIVSGKIDPPARTIRMKWVEEIQSIQRWSQTNRDEFEDTKAAIVLDMVGEDVAKTGGSFLIEKMPDPSAIWTRPPDTHTAWGQTTLTPDDLQGSYLNDLFWQACRLRAEQTRWQIKTNPFEGGSDHVPFLHHGIPAVLAWHFTDVYYHTSGDDLDKVSPAEMANVAASVTATAAFLANCNTNDAKQVLHLIEKQARWRLENETQNSVTALRNQSAVERKREDEERLITAWASWYKQAFESTVALPIIENNKEQLTRAVQLASTHLDKFTYESIDRLRHVRRKTQDIDRR